MAATDMTMTMVSADGRDIGPFEIAEGALVDIEGECLGRDAGAALGHDEHDVEELERSR